MRENECPEIKIATDPCVKKRFILYFLPLKHT